MPKLKTHRGAAKRFRKTATGFKHRRATRSHGFTNKTMKRKRHLHGSGLVDKSDFKSVERLLHGS